MEEFTRYAIYWLPEGALGAWGEAWLGWRMADGTPLPQPHVAGLPGDISTLTAAATAYGLHATVKPPFRLAPGRDAQSLRAAFAKFCASEQPVLAGPLALDEIDGFLALRPVGETAEIDALAARVVMSLDAFRAPAPAAEIARRRAAGLSPAQEALLARWGYPYVMDEFRFHVTLTGRLTPEDAGKVRAAIAPLLAPCLPPRLRIGGLSLVGQMQGGGFRLIDHHAFSG